MKTLTKKLFVPILAGFGFSANAQCVAAFSVTALTPAGTYSFTNLSTGTSSTALYYYNFGNGSSWGPGSGGNATATFSTNQVYTVTMNVVDSLNSCFSNAAQIFTVNNVGCNASPVISSQQGANGLVNFSHNLGLTPNSVFWNFGDGGNGSSGSHTYLSSGLYNVSCTVVTQGAVCTYTASSSVSVTIITCSLTASFSYTTGAGGQVNFASTSTGTTASSQYYWNFGDGYTAYTPNPTHTYVMAGTYSVNFSVLDSSSGVNCSDWASQLVNVTSCPNQTSFWMMRDSTQLLTWNAYPQYPSNISGATWSWGDGSSTNGLYPSHTYSAAGNYTICLSATVSCGTSTSTCVSTSIYKPAGGGDGGGMITLNVVDLSKVGLAKHETLLQMHIYPNPSSGRITIAGLNDNPIKVEMFDLLGKSVLSTTIVNDGSLDIGHLDNGIYYLTAGRDNAQRSIKVVLNK